MEISTKKAVFTSNGNGIDQVRITIPKDWANEIGLKKEDRSVLLTFDGQTITIEKNEK